MDGSISSLSVLHLEHDVEREKDAGGDGNANEVVDGRKEEIHPDPPHGLPGQVEAGENVQEVVLNEDDVGGLEGNVRPGPDGNADVRLGEGGRVVDAVPDHGDAFALSLEALDFADLVRREDFGEDSRYPNLTIRKKKRKKK